MTRPVRVLALDGGGIYQMTTAMALVELERRTGRRIADLFDLVAGTSAGALLGLACLVPGPDGRPRYSADEILTLYEEGADRVFSSSLWHWLKALGGLIDEKYETTGLEEALSEVFGETPLSAGLLPTLIPVYDIDRDVAQFFRAHRARTDPSAGFRMREVVRAATAAPAYFPPARITSEAGDSMAGIDGGVVAFNPALWGYLEALEVYRDAPEVVVASFGASRRNHGLTYDTVRGWGRANWAGPLFELMCDAGATGVDAQMQRLLHADGRDHRYFRFDARIERPHTSALDDASAQNLRTVREIGEDMIWRETARLDRLCRRLADA